MFVKSGRRKKRIYGGLTGIGLSLAYTIDCTVANLVILILSIHEHIIESLHFFCLYHYLSVQFFFFVLHSGFKHLSLIVFLDVLFFLICFTRKATRACWFLCTNNFDYRFNHFNGKNTCLNRMSKDTKRLKILFCREELNFLLLGTREHVWARATSAPLWGPPPLPTAMLPLDCCWHLALRETKLFCE